jgi:hypothetical protein
MDSSVSPKYEIWFLRVRHDISNAVYKSVISKWLLSESKLWQGLQFGNESSILESSHEPNHIKLNSKYSSLGHISKSVNNTVRFCLLYCVVVEINVAPRGHTLRTQTKMFGPIPVLALFESRIFDFRESKCFLREPETFMEMNNHKHL